MKHSIRCFIDTYHHTPELLPTQAEQDSVSIFFNQADEISIEEIWTLQVGEIKLWQCLLALTCFLDTEKLAHLHR